MEVSGQLHGPAALPPGKDHLPLDRRVGGPQSRSGRGGKEKFPAPTENPTMQPRSSSP
jgi:hypothetical protein